jgi:hypothetical protein
MNWDGESLRDELAELLSDTSTSFKAKVVDWMNDIIFNISTAHDWPFYRVSLKKNLTQSTEEQSLIVDGPGAPTLAVAAGGSLTADEVINVAVTYYNPTKKIETILGTSASATPTGANLLINLTAIPTTTETTFTQRRIYMRNSTDSGDWYLSSTITDMTTTTAQITAEPATTAEKPPTLSYLKRLDGKPRIASISRVLDPMALQQIQLISSGSIQSGTPYRFSELSSDSIVLDKKPATSLILDFYGFRRPRKVYASITSYPDIIPELKELLKLGVKWKGYEFRERADASDAWDKYNTALTNAIQELGRSAKYPFKVQDVAGNSNGLVEV